MSRAGAAAAAARLNTARAGPETARPGPPGAGAARSQAPGLPQCRAGQPESHQRRSGLTFSECNLQTRHRDGAADKLRARPASGPLTRPGEVGPDEFLSPWLSHGLPG